jgi:hypothetical protein
VVVGAAALQAAVASCGELVRAREVAIEQRLREALPGTFALHHRQQQGMANSRRRINARYQNRQHAA